MKNQAALQLVRSTLDLLEGQETVGTDDDLIALLRERGIASNDADLLVALLPVAFGRATLQQMGVTSFPDKALVHHPGGRITEIRLSDQPIYEAGVEVGVVSLHHGTPTPLAFRMLATRSPELTLTLEAIEAGDPPGSGRILPPRFVGYEDGVFVKSPWWRRRLF